MKALTEADLRRASEVGEVQFHRIPEIKLDASAAAWVQELQQLQADTVERFREITARHGFTGWTASVEILPTTDGVEQT